MDITIAAVVGGIVSFLTHRFKRAGRLDDYWRSWKPNNKYRIWGMAGIATAGGAAGGVAARYLAQAVELTSTGSNVLSAAVGGVLAWVLITALASVSSTRWAKYFQVGSLGMAWLEERCEDYASREAQTFVRDLTRDQVRRSAYGTHSSLSSQNKLDAHQSAADATLMLAALEKLKNQSTDIQGEGRSDLNSYLHRLITKHHVTRDEIG